MSNSSESTFHPLAIRPRPSNRVVVVYASGAHAGQSLGFDQHHLTVGRGEQFDIPVDSQGTNVSLRIERQNNGWIANLETGDSFIINQEFCSSSTALRSGDLIRLSWRGPDVQFYLQSGAPSVRQLAEEHLGSDNVGPDTKQDSSPLNVGMGTSQPTPQATIPKNVPQPNVPQPNVPQPNVPQPVVPQPVEATDLRRTVAVTSQQADFRATTAVSPDILKAANLAAEQQKAEKIDLLNQKSLALAFVVIAILFVLLLLYILSSIWQRDDRDSNPQSGASSIGELSANEVSFDTDLPIRGAK